MYLGAQIITICQEMKQSMIIGGGEPCAKGDVNSTSHAHFCAFADDYFNSRMPVVMKRIAQGGVRLAMVLNRVFGEPDEGFATPT